MFGKGHDYKGNRVSPMQLVILLLLRKRPMYGYEVLKELRERFKGVWTPQTGSIYPSIKRLEEHGLVRSEKREGTDYYSLSEEGEKWVMEKVRRSPKDIRILTRYLRMIEEAAADMHLDGEEPVGECRDATFVDLFEGEETDKARRAKRLRVARAHIAGHLAQIDQELKDLESNNENGGKIE